MSKITDQPPAYDHAAHHPQPAQPSQAHLYPRAQQAQPFSPNPYQQNQGYYGGPPQGFAPPDPQGYYGQDAYRGPESYYDIRDRRWHASGGSMLPQPGYYPQPGGYYSQPGGYYSQPGGYYPQQHQPQYGYHQSGYYDDSRSKGTGFCAILFGSMAACCCLNLLLF